MDRSDSEKVEALYPPSLAMSGRDYVRIIRERLWILILVVCLAFGVAVVRTLLTTPTYVASARLQIDPVVPKIKGIENPAESAQSVYGFWGFKEYFKTQLENLKSPALRAKVAERPPVQQALRRFWQKKRSSDAPDFIEQFLPRSSKDRSPVPEAGEGSGILPLPPLAVHVNAVRDTRLVDVSVETEDAELAAVFANELAAAFQEENLEQRMKRSSEALEWLAKRARDLEKQVAEAEMALQDYKAREDTIALEDQSNIVTAELEQLNEAVTRAKTERIAAERTYRQLQNFLEGDVPVEQLPAALTVSEGFRTVLAQLGEKKAELARLQERYLDKHPKVIEAKAELQGLREHARLEARNLLEQAKADLDLLRAREEGLQAALEEQEKKAMLLDRKAVEYGILERQAETTRKLYSSILQRMEEASVAGTVESNNITLVKEAVPPGRPAKPNKPRILVAYTGFGFVVAVAFILFLNMLDDRIRSQEDVENSLKIPFLGYVPVIAKRSSVRRDRVVADDPTSTTAEAFRNVRAAIGFSEEKDPIKLLVITSASPGEGKSLVASNLAISYAQTGARTLLVDADMRRPSVHHIFAVERSPGFSDALSGTHPLQSTAVESGIENLYVCSAGSPVPNPAELLAGEGLRAFLTEAAESFDRIVFDTPPVSAVSEPLLLAPQVDGVVLVTQFRRLRTPLAKRIVVRLIRAHARIIGAVINRIDVRKGAYNYYYYGYYDSYEYGEDGKRKKAQRKVRRKRRHADGRTRRPAGSSSSTPRESSKSLPEDRDPPADRVEEIHAE